MDNHMDNLGMSLAEQIAREHWIQWHTPESVKCGSESCAMPVTPAFGVVDMLFTERAHIATVTEQAVREQVAAMLEREADLDMKASGERLPGVGRLSTPVSRRLRRIARDIARGATP